MISQCYEGERSSSEALSDASSSVYPTSSVYVRYFTHAAIYLTLFVTLLLAFVFTFEPMQYRF